MNTIEKQFVPETEENPTRTEFESFLDKHGPSMAVDQKIYPLVAEIETDIEQKNDATKIGRKIQELRIFLKSLVDYIDQEVFVGDLMADKPRQREELLQFKSHAEALQKKADEFWVRVRELDRRTPVS